MRTAKFFLVSGVYEALVSLASAQTDPDPWNAITYATGSDGNFELPSPSSAIADGISFNTDTPCTDVDGRVVVVHAPSNDKIGCGVLGYDAWTETFVSSTDAGVVDGETTSAAGYLIDSSSGVSLKTADNTAYNAFGRAVVLHATDGTRIACGCCVGDASLKMKPYPDYAGNITVAGNVTVTTSIAPAMVHLEANLEGVEASATLGLHIHTGTSCAVAGDVGGHLYDTATAVIGPIPSYSGNLSVSGTAVVSQSGTDDAIAFSAYLVDDLVGVDGGDKIGANATGGIHIHEGKTCADVGPHFYSPVCTTTTTTDADTTTTTTTTKQLSDDFSAAPVVSLAATTVMLCAVVGR